jgi:CRP/FNR family transcriptional regulator, cyclic AMP receptor protein
MTKPSKDKLWREHIPAHALIFMEGQAGEALYFLEEGRVEIWQGALDGEHHTLGFVEAGEIFGEMALVDNSPRMASASAVSDVQVVRIPGEEFRSRLHETDPLIALSVRLLVTHIRKLSGRL